MQTKKLDTLETLCYITAMNDKDDPVWKLLTFAFLLGLLAFYAGIATERERVRIQMELHQLKLQEQTDVKRDTR